MSSKHVSFKGDTVRTTWLKIQSVFGKSEDNFDRDKQNAQWNITTPDKVYFELYDWKEGPITLEDNIEWHIAADSVENSRKALEYLKSKL